MSGSVAEIELIGDELPWLKDLRQKGADAFRISGIPTPKAEPLF